MSDKKMNFSATWAMAVGGMVGGGIFSVLGVVISYAAQWAWMSFVIAGIIALISAKSYSQLSIKYGEGGGAFTFLRKIDHKGFAGSLSWVLIMGYILTMAVYAFTFGHYVAHIFDAGPWLSRLLAFSVITMLTIINLKGVGNASTFEIITVYGKIIVLLGLAIYGISFWSPEQLTHQIKPEPWHTALIGAATIFMAYEGFQLLSYDYNDLKEPDKTLPKATVWAVAAVILIYVLVTLGATMLVGAETLIKEKEVALAIAGKEAMGATGLIIVTIAAAFSTGSAINATLFSTARLMESVAKKKDLPHVFVKENEEHIPYYAVLTIAVLSVMLAMLGDLDSLVDAASIIFLFTFGTVNFIAYREKIPKKWISLIGAVACVVAIVADIIEKFKKTPYVLLGLILLTGCIFVFRPYILKKMN